ncbi:hypothetical protein STEG23_033580, partial [Scotinomys teguina]
LLDASSSSAILTSRETLSLLISQCQDERPQNYPRAPAHEALLPSLFGTVSEVTSESSTSLSPKFQWAPFSLPCDLSEKAPEHEQVHFCK